MDPIKNFIRTLLVLYSFILAVIFSTSEYVMLRTEGDSDCQKPSVGMKQSRGIYSGQGICMCML
jgi:hypothetical protein